MCGVLWPGFPNSQLSQPDQPFAQPFAQPNLHRQTQASKAGNQKTVLTQSPTLRASFILTMAEAVGLTASIIAIVELSAKVGKLCLDYSTAVSNARQDISRLHDQVDGLSKTLQEARGVIDGPDGQSLTASQNLLDSLDGCISELVELHKQLDLGKRARAMRRFGLRALKWPFDMQEVVDIISRLERYERTIHLGLQVDQT